MFHICYILKLQIKAKIIIARQLTALVNFVIKLCDLAQSVLFIEIIYPQFFARIVGGRKYFILLSISILLSVLGKYGMKGRKKAQREQNVGSAENLLS